MLAQARSLAQSILDRDPQLSAPENALLQANLPARQEIEDFSKIS